MLSDKALFAQHITVLTRATSDDDKPTPGYLLRELQKITSESTSSCHYLIEFLTHKLEIPSPYVKIKVLKIMFDLTENGDKHFRLLLRKYDNSIKIASNFSGPPDPLLGSSLYESVRKTAKDLLSALFDPDLILQDDGMKAVEAKPKLQLGGLGTTAPQKGKYEGFGSSPNYKGASIKTKVVDFWEKLVNPVDETADLIKAAFDSPIGNYKAANVNPFIKKHLTYEPTKCSVQSISIKPHIPGRAGGGWESDAPNDTELSSSNVSTDSLEKIKPPVLEEGITERQVINEICQGIRELHSQVLLSEMFDRCASLNCVEVIKALGDVLNEEIDNSRKLVALLLVETFLRHNLVSVDTLSKVLLPILSKIVSSDSPCKVKAEKVCLIIERRQSKFIS